MNFYNQNLILGFDLLANLLDPEIPRKTSLKPRPSLLGWAGDSWPTFRTAA